MCSSVVRIAILLLPFQLKSRYQISVARRRMFVVMASSILILERKEKWLAECVLPERPTNPVWTGEEVRSARTGRDDACRGSMWTDEAAYKSATASMQAPAQSTPPDRLRESPLRCVNTSRSDRKPPTRWIYFLAFLGGNLLDYSSDFEIQERRVSGLALQVFGRTT